MNATQTITKVIPQPNGKSAHIQVSFVLITPAIASEMLDRTADHQRDVKSFSIFKLESDMNESKWHFTGAPIVFDESNELVDGQHRLTAIVASKSAQWMIVVSGVQRDAYIAIDSGVRKSTADFFRFDGIPNANFASATANWLLRYEKLNDGKLFHSSLVSKAMIEDTYHKFSDAIQDAHGRHKALGTFIGSSSAIAALYIIISKAYGEEFCNRFLDSLSTGISEGVVKKLHDAIDRDNKARRKHIAG